VRVALAENIFSLCPLISQKEATDTLVSIGMRILKDEASEVRLALFKGLESLNQVVGIDIVQSKLLPCLKELQQEKSKNWRLRITVIEQYPMLAKQLGEDFFNEKLNSMCKVSLRDPVFTVREGNKEAGGCATPEHQRKRQDQRSCQSSRVQVHD